ncbi:MAG: SulP family inorganic anion transporter [Myxococcota bacterium]
MATDLAAPRLAESLPKDLVASVVVFLVALPLCLGVALASGAPLFSGLLAGIVGGLVVGALSGSHASVSGPAAGLTAVVAAQIAALGTFEAFLSAVVLAGLIQIAAGLGQAGFIAAYFPSSVIKGLLAAIGIILILKQIPHLLGHDTDPVGEMAFDQPDQQNTFTELWQTLLDLHPGAALVGLGSLAFLFVWDRMAFLKSSRVPAPLVVVVLGIAASLLLEGVGGAWAIGASHSVQVPVLSEGESFLSLLTRPDFSVLARPEVYVAALTIALVASLETLLNREAVEAHDPDKRTADPNRELLAQGVGNVSAGLIGGIPVTSVIIRSSVNLQAGARTRLSAIVHGGLLLVCVLTIPAFLTGSRRGARGDPDRDRRQAREPGAHARHVEPGSHAIPPPPSRSSPSSSRTCSSASASASAPPCSSSSRATCSARCAASTRSTWGEKCCGSSSRIR